MDNTRRPQEYNYSVTTHVVGGKRTYDARVWNERFTNHGGTDYYEGRSYNHGSRSAAIRAALEDFTYRESW